MTDPVPSTAMRAPLRRRTFLGSLAAGAMAATAGGLLGGCADSTPRGAEVNLQLNYLKNVQFAGCLMADQRGFYRDSGLAVTLLAGGPSTAVESVVQSGQALVGITHVAQAVNAVNNGADLKIIGADYQKNPFCVVSTAQNPLHGPQDMIGKKIGVSNTNTPVWNAFLAANGIAQDAVKVVKIQFDPAPLVMGDVDGFMAFFTNEPVNLNVMGIPTFTFKFDDFNYPLLEDVYITKGATLADPGLRHKVTALMKAQILGWQEAVAHPDQAAKLAVTVYGADLKLDLVQQTRQAMAQNSLVADQDTAQHGLLWMTEQKITNTARSLALGGSQANPATFTTEILQQIYQGRSRL